MNRAIWVAAAIVAVAFMGSTLLTPLYAVYRHAFGFSEIVLTLVYAIYVLGNFTSLLFFGRISDVIGRRRVALPSLGVIVVSMLVFFFAHSTAWLLVARALSGLGIGLASGTATAWLADLYDTERTRAAIVATLANAIGAGFGPLLAGALVQWAPWPLHLSFIVYLAILIAIGLATWFVREQPRHASARVSFAPRIGIPENIRADFIAPAVAAFGTFALIGYYAALIPTILSDALHDPSPFVGGAVVAELFLATAITIFVSRNLGSHTSMLHSLRLFIPSVALLAFAQSAHSLPILLVASACAGVAGGLGYRGSLQVINKIAPEASRAEVVSAYFIVVFVGNAVPVIGVGLIAAITNSMTASVIFAIMIAGFAAATTIYEGTRKRSSQAASHG